jgi:GNAT superfamily N-acetyltransferase
MFSIRNANEGDAEILLELYMRHLTANPPGEMQSIDRWRELLREIGREPGYHLLVGEENGIVCSSVTCIIIRNLTHNLRPYALIENVVTHASYRGRGFASALMARAVQIAGQSGCYKVMLMTGSKKDETLRFYENCGFNRNEKTAFIKRLP